MTEQRISQLEAENAELREKLECAARQNASNMQAFAECVEQRRAAILRHQRIVRGLYRILNDAEESSDRQVPRSACVFCPYKSDDEWLLLREIDPAGWQRAVEIDRAIRDKTSVCTQGMQSAQYLHRSCTPLELVQLNPSAPDRQKRMVWNDMDCEGMCGV